MSDQEKVKGSGSMEFDGLLAEFHQAIWLAAEKCDCDYDLAGIDVAKKLQAMFRDKELIGDCQGAAQEMLEALILLATDYHNKGGLGFDLHASTKMFAAINKAKGLV